MTPKLSVVIPAYNEEENISFVVQSITQMILSQDSPFDFEIIVVDDHSSDKTFDSVVSLNDPRVRCIRLSRRSGSHIALRAGFLESKGQAVLCTSADGQDDLSILRSMLAQLQKGYQVIWACRQNRQDESAMYRLATGAFYNFLAFICKSSPEEKNIVRNADFFLLDRTVVESLNAFGETHTSVFGLIIWGGFKQTFVEYVRKARRAGKSKWNFKKRVALAKDWVLSFSNLPIQLVFLTGSLIVSWEILNFIWVFINKEEFSLLSTVLLMGGLQLIAISVVGEYVWYSLREARRRPLYFIEQRSR